MKEVQKKAVHMTLCVEVSIGELIDKITILELKLENIREAAKRANVAHEYAVLIETFNKNIKDDNSMIAELRHKLRMVNAELWRIEDDIRAQERAQTFGADFIRLARAVYQMNDRRAALKREINMLTQSGIVEEKSYEAY
jgi:hypothetical protein